jgi:hypothetical protein
MNGAALCLSTGLRFFCNTRIGLALPGDEVDGYFIHTLNHIVWKKSSSLA